VVYTDFLIFVCMIRLERAEDPVSFWMCAREENFCLSLFWVVGNGHRVRDLPDIDKSDLLLVLPPQHVVDIDIDIGGPSLLRTVVVFLGFSLWIRVLGGKKDWSCICTCVQETKQGFREGVRRIQRRREEKRGDEERKANPHPYLDPLDTHDTPRNATQAHRSTDHYHSSPFLHHAS